MTGWLIVNEYLNTEKFRQLQDLFAEAADKCGVELVKHTNAEFVVGCGKVFSRAFEDGTPDFVIFYDKDVRLARALEEMGLRVFNSAEAIEICDSKVKTAQRIYAWNSVQSARLTRVVNNDAGEHIGLSVPCLGACDDAARKIINMPRTFVVPFTYENVGINENSDFNYLDMIADEIGYPMIIKESYSSFGMGVHLAHDRAEAVKLICECGAKECLVQEFVVCSDCSGAGKSATDADKCYAGAGDSSNASTAKSGAVDVRLQMVGDECVAAMMRSNEHDYRANITNGGVMSTYEPTEEDLILARNAMKALGLDFAGIDIMHSNGKAVFLEANSNAHFKNLYDLTGINAAEYMIKYIVSQLSE